MSSFPSLTTCNLVTEKAGVVRSV